ncbi:hypothetical protein [Telluribacter humicola]|uniref:hypothetical protein n=1 Tax=Telluribacter humicola TaxID=1720261 RepID=UPI001A95A62B|nr:hypothetical protein [Telluribacter humicola]
MNAKNLFTFVAIIVSLFGLGFTFAPEFMGEQYLTNPAWINDGTKVLAQAYGTHLIAYAVACWYVRDAGSSIGGKVMLLSVFLSNLALIVITSMAVLNGIEKTTGWGQVVLSLVLAAWSGMLLRQTDRVVA